MKFSSLWATPQHTLALLLSLLLIPLPVLGEGVSSSQPAGKIIAVAPGVTVNEQAVSENDILRWNEALVTENSGRARLNLSDGSALGVGANSSIKVVQQDLSSQQTELALDRGIVRNVVVKRTKPGAKYEIRTPNALVTVTGTDLVVSYVNGMTRVVVLKGTANVSAIGAAVNSATAANGGQMIDVAGAAAPTVASTPNSVQLDSIRDTAMAGVPLAVPQAATAGENHKWRNFFIAGAVAGIATGFVIGTTDSGSRCRRDPTGPGCP